MRTRQPGTWVGYEPYQHFAPNFNPAESFYSDRLPDRAGANAGYELTVTDADGDNPKSKLVDFARAGAPNAATRSPRLVIDKFGRIGIEDNGPPWIEVESPSWQTERQREFLQRIMDRQQEFARRANGNESITWSRKTPSAGNSDMVSRETGGDAPFDLAGKVQEHHRVSIRDLGFTRTKYAPALL